MLYGMIYAIAVSFLAVLCSPLFTGIFKDSGLKRRLLSHILFLPVYATIGIFWLFDSNSNAGESHLLYGLPLFNGLFLYLVLFLLYESVVSKVERSVTVKMFLEIYQRGQGPHVERTSGDIIDKEEMLLTRVDGLLREKFIESRNSRYRITARGARSAKIIICIRNLFWAL